MTDDIKNVASDLGLNEEEARALMATPVTITFVLDDWASIMAAVNLSYSLLEDDAEERARYVRILVEIAKAASQVE